MGHIKKLWVRYKSLVMVLLLSSLLSFGLYFIRTIFTDNDRYWFMLWNLILAWVPLVFGVILFERLKKSSWLTWQNLLLTVLWLIFLPNSFYMVSDAIHLNNTGEISLLFDVAMFVSFAWNGLLLGFISVFAVHNQLLKRMPAKAAHITISFVLLACSFAIYLGRYSRWNTWDILTNPAGLLFDVSDRFINPGAHPLTYSTTATMFVLLAGIYFITWKLVKLIRQFNV